MLSATGDLSKSHRFFPETRNLPVSAHSFRETLPPFHPGVVTGKRFTKIGLRWLLRNPKQWCFRPGWRNWQTRQT